MSIEKTAISVADLSQFYGSSIGVEGISSDVAPGEIVGFLGPNGSGKTTVMRLLLHRSFPLSITSSTMAILPDNQLLSFCMTKIKTVKKLSVVAVSVTTLLALSACGGSSNSDSESSSKEDSSVETGAYPSEVRDEFMSSCATSAGADSVTEEEAAMIDDLCGCVFDAIEAELTFDEFVAAEEDILAGNASGIDLEAIAATCME